MIRPGSHGARGDGARTCFEFAVRFHDWARLLTEPLSPALIADYWHVSRATSYRYFAAYNAARARTERLLEATGHPAMLEAA